MAKQDAAIGAVLVISLLAIAIISFMFYQLLLNRNEEEYRAPIIDLSVTGGGGDSSPASAPNGFPSY